MSDRRRDIQFSAVESGASGDSFASLSPKVEREAQEKEPNSTSTSVRMQGKAVPRVEISQARDRAIRTAQPTNISPTQEKAWLPPPMPEHLRDFPTPHHTYEQAMKNMRERMERGEKVSALDLIATHESYFARDLDREEALREMEKLTEKLKRIRERHGDKRMIQTLTKRLYARRYNFRQNTMLGLFTGSERGNCQATAKAASTILEQVGLDPKTEIAHQMFSDHVRAVAKIEDRWHVLEGRARLLGSKETMGTVFVSLQDENRGLLGLAPESPIELGEASFHTQDGTVQNPGLAAWLKRGLSKADVWFGSRLRHKTPSIHHRSGERSASLIGMANIES